MNKSILVGKIAADAGITKDQASKALDSFTGSVTESLKNEEDVSLVGFGTFTLKHRAARQGRNPQTGESIQIKAAKVPGFKAGKGLKDAVQ